VALADALTAACVDASVAAIATDDNSAKPSAALARCATSSVSVDAAGRLYVSPGDSTSKLLVVPHSRQRAICESAHSIGHQGTGKTIGRIKTEFWFSKMYKVVNDVVSSCVACQRLRRPPPPTPDGVWPRASRLERVHIDHMFLPPDKNGFNCALVMVDDATGITEIVPAKHRRAGGDDSTGAIDGVCAQLESFWFCRYGAPRFLVTDNASEFKSKAMDKLLSKWGVQRVEITPHNHQANGIAEVTVRTIKRTLAALSHGNEQATNWRKLLPFARFAMHTAVSAPRKVSPFLLLTGTQPHSAAARRQGHHHDEPAMQAEQTAEHVVTVTSELAAGAAEARQQAKLKRPATKPHIPIVVDNLVWLHDNDGLKQGRVAKFKLNDGPFVVVAIDSKRPRAKLAVLATMRHLPGWFPLRRLHLFQGDVTRPQPPGPQPGAVGWSGANDRSALSDAQSKAEDVSERRTQRRIDKAVRSAELAAVAHETAVRQLREATERQTAAAAKLKQARVAADQIRGVAPVASSPDVVSSTINNLPPPPSFPPPPPPQTQAEPHTQHARPTGVLYQPLQRPVMQTYYPRQLLPTDIADVQRCYWFNNVEYMDVRLRDGSVRSTLAASMPVWRQRWHDVQAMRQAGQMNGAPSHQTGHQPPPPTFGY